MEQLGLLPAESEPAFQHALQTAPMQVKAVLLSERPPGLPRHPQRISQSRAHFSSIFRRAAEKAVPTGRLGAQTRTPSDPVRCLRHRPVPGGSHKEPRELSTVPGTQRASRSVPAIFSSNCRDKSCKDEAGKGSLSEALIWEQKDQSQTMIGGVGEWGALSTEQITNDQKDPRIGRG